uniref:uncharacterized protein LOC120336473 isoform X2 n=1 Tax=Styela clava TaxID=7725 RepID=UPI00193A23CE|nr:uncharacterized protein LOC120336473 isoform X2 [Styela clava]
MLSVLFILVLMTGTSMAVDDCEVTEENTNTFKVYYGWPFTYRCVNIFTDINYDYDLENYGDYTCVITEVESGKVLWKTAFTGSLYDDTFEGEVDFTFDSIDQTTPTEYRTNLQNASSCWIEHFTLEPLELPIETCEENLSYNFTHNFDKSVGSTFNCLCDVPRDSNAPMELVNDDTVSQNGGTRIYWLYNCGKELPDNAAMNYDKTSLILTNISYQANPGVYTCVVEHNNMKRYRIHRKICVREKISRPVTISCDGGRAVIGEDIEIVCHVDAGVGQDTSIAFYGRFNKLNVTGEIDYTKKNSSCVSFANRGSHSSEDKRFSCVLNIDGEGKRKCFYRPPSDEEIKQQRTSLTMRYKIKNVQLSDFGTYRAQINRNNLAQIFNFTISHNKERFLAKHNFTLIVCISVVCGFGLFFVMLCALCGVELRWFWFKLCAAQEKEIKKYSSYLAYYYSRDTSQNQSPQLEAFIMNLSTRLQRIGGPVFDRCREPSTEQYKAESIYAELGQCHRVIIILTPEYINDQWSVYEAYEAWKNVIENGIKIMFITFPNTNSAISNLPDESRTALKKALQRHQVIHWTGILPFTKRMRMQLEMFMPKLPQADAMELKVSRLDDDDQLLTSKQNGHSVSTQQKDTNGNVYHSSLNI